ncbi:hypothetical protein B0H34DRAFT_372141 [Crassisporium funariophilum]|nr:hypothetical protein B0H34DRAFT_372141 [Crassisporium funariophilum]
MTETMLSEKRTRSQLILPDDILQLPQGSPMKDARTALRNHSAVDGSSSASKTPSDETDDELLLSPGKNETYMRTDSNSKRSASPPFEDEYSPVSGSPSDNRELKRVKRELAMEDCDRRSHKARASPHQRSTRGHVRNHSDSDVLIGRRSVRKRSVITSKKPVSTVSVSPTPTTFSPASLSGKSRAQSVPLFATSDNITRIDFRNPPPSPKRLRSRSRSPSKDREPKLRIVFTAFAPSSGLVTIQDEAASNMDVVEEPGIVVEKAVLPIGEVEPLDITTGDTGSIVLPTPQALETTFSNIPSTPVAKHSLNKLIPMSPLTPLPETPFQARLLSNEDRYTDHAGWGAPPQLEFAGSKRTLEPIPTIPPSASKSRLPRPSLDSSVPVINTKHTTKMRPPTIPASFAFNKQSTSNIGKVGAILQKDIGSAPRRNAFDVLMGKPSQLKPRLEQGSMQERKVTEKPLAQVPRAGASTLFSLSKEKEVVREAPGKPKMSAKLKMKPKPKAKISKTLLPVRALDEDEDEDEDGRLESELADQPETEDFVASSISPEPGFLSMPPGLGSSEAAILLNPLNNQEQEAVGNSSGHKLTMARQDAHDHAIQDLPVQIQVTVHPTLVHVADANAFDEVQRMQIPPSGGEAVEVTSADKAAVFSEPESSHPQEAEITKLPLGKKRQPLSAVPVSRVTRSVSSRRKGEDLSSSQAASTSTISHEKPVTFTAPGPAPIPAKRTASGLVKPSSTVPSLHKPIDKPRLPPGSPMKLSSPAKTAASPVMTKVGMQTMQYSAGTLSLTKTPTKSKIPTKPTYIPSPSKLVRTTSLFAATPLDHPAASLTRTYSVDMTQLQAGAGSSLSTLSNALEKLSMPAPSRPNTSMGFNRDAPGDDDCFEGHARSKDDETIGRTSLGMGRPDGGLKRAATVGAAGFKATGSNANAAASSSKASGATKPLVQKSLTMFMPPKTGVARGSHLGGAIMHARGTAGLSGKAPGMFGIGGGLRRTISKKTSLPSVMASPMKGGLDERMADEGDNMDQTLPLDPSGDDLSMAPVNSNDDVVMKDLKSSDSGKGKEKATTSHGSNASRRVSMVSHALSQSLSALPLAQTTNRGQMGPPATPPASARTGVRSSSSSYPSTTASGDSPPQAGTLVGTRASTRIAKTAPGALMKIKGGTDGHVSSGRKGGAEAAAVPNPAADSLKILNDCVISVDVRTDDGDEAGSLFIEMLEGVGARVLTRVGQTCTHLVFKNGLMSTLTRYRLLRDPKPLVVGIAWVVECVEQRKRVDESDFLVDLEGMNVAGINKRRRSMLPKMFPTELSFPPDAENEDGDGDQSMDGSTSSLTMDDALPPLELARRRKNMMTAAIKP